ncbi:M14 family metallopeptidase [Anthocerotibacter panamensis]|uniref:M14 family metallopeptidase n=1 Tax=Anthocerotibacter panamensis TaxID=2857077 RepID=UPI001C407D16|nr:M14 family metallopeptidase [Anthocerotibacter panamensis]
MESVTLTILDHLPDGLLDCSLTELHRVLAGPTLIHLPGRRSPALFISVLLHGNEDTSWRALRALLQKYEDQTLPRALSFFIGNVAAAQSGERHLAWQPDYNRIWDEGTTPEHAMTRQVIAEMEQRGVFASVDIHNNTGLNPHYACVNRLEPEFLHLATLFGRTVVYFTHPASVQSLAFAQFCPAVVLECGKTGQQRGCDHALEFLEACLHLAQIPSRPLPPQDVDLFQTVVVIKVPQQFSFGFGDRTKDVCLDPDLDHLNFRELRPGTRLGYVRPGSGGRLAAWNQAGRDVGERYFQIRDGELQTLMPVMPSMLTLDTQVIRQDCLCYLMERCQGPSCPI